MISPTAADKQSIAEPRFEESVLRSFVDVNLTPQNHLVREILLVTAYINREILAFIAHRLGCLRKFPVDHFSNSHWPS